MASWMFKFSSLSLLLVLLAPEITAQVYDVTKYGATADEKTDIAQALTSAWKEACASSSPSKVVIPAGKYLLGKVTLEGPCKAPIELQAEGTLIAPSDANSLGDAWLTINRIDGFTLSGKGTFDGKGQDAWKLNQCAKTRDCKMLTMNFRFNFITNAIVQDITSLDSKNFHMNCIGCKNMTFQHVTITAPGDSANTDGIHIGSSNGIYIIDTNIGTGDDCISIGFGSKDVHITGVTCGPGHGISVGSLGQYPDETPVSGIYVKGCTISGTTNGVRIKSWPAMHANTATDIHFEDVTMDNVANPVLIDQEYCPHNHCTKEAPSKVKLSNISFKNVRGTSSTPVAVQLLCSKGIPCEGVELSDIDLSYSGPQGPAKSVCTNVAPKISGTFNPAGC